MAVGYPIRLPVWAAPQITSWKAPGARAVTMSPYDGSQQVQAFPPEPMVVELSFPPMARAQADELIALLLSCQFDEGTLLLGDLPGAQPRGAGMAAVAAKAGYPRVYLASQVAGAKALAARGFKFSTVPLFAGDWIQVARNYLAGPQDMTNAAWITNNCTKGSANAITADMEDLSFPTAQAERITPDASQTNVYLYQAVTIPHGPAEQWNFAVWLKAASGTPTIRLVLRSVHNVAPSRGSVDCALTTTWQRFVVSGYFEGTAATVMIGGESSWPTADGAVDVYGAAFWSPGRGARLYKVRQPVTIEADSGFHQTDMATGTFDIYPSLREAPVEWSPLIFNNPVGEFRLLDDMVDWSIDKALRYGISLTLMEAF